MCAGMHNIPCGDDTVKRLGTYLPCLQDALHDVTFIRRLVNQNRNNNRTTKKRASGQQSVSARPMLLT